MAVKVREKQPGSGIWWIFIDHQGQRKAKKIGKNKKLALKVAEQIQAKLTLGEFRIDPEEKEIPTFKAYAERWLELYVKPLRRQSTYERYQQILQRRVFPKIGQMSLDTINRGDIRTLLMSLLAEGLSWASVCLVRDVISGPMSYAVDEELIPANPVSGILKRAVMKRDQDNEIDPLTPEEVGVFLDTCRSHYPEYYPFFLCAFRTGMRLGELLALRWGDVDWRGKFILVRRSFRRGLTTGTKTGKQRRVDISEQLYEALQDLYLQRKKEALASGSGEVTEVIFHRHGEPMPQNSIRHVFKRVLRKAGLRDIRFHDIRHTYASLLLTAGVSPVYVKEQLGHSSIQMTVDIYGHLIPSSNRDQVNLLDSQPAATYPQPAEIQKA